MVESLKKQAVCAVVVTYNPDLAFGTRAAQLAKQVGHLIIVDNASEPDTLRNLSRIACDLDAELIRNPANLGLATALNQGVLLADAKGYRWALTLDQDSVPREDMAERLIAVYEESQERELLAVVGSDHPNNATRKASTSTNDCSPSSVERTVLISSGSLMSLDAFRVVGLFRAALFIDHVDIEYCLRARSKGFRIMAVRAPLMEHVIGAPSSHRLPWKWTTTTNHPPIRRYYMARNMIVLLRNYLALEPRYILSALWSWLKSTLLMLLFEHDRLSKLKATASGLRAGLSFDLDG